MQNSANQFYLLFIFLFSGFLIGIIFDLFRILRKSFKTSDLITYIEDFIFWIITGTYLLIIIFKFSFGQIRLYMFISLIIGFIVYILTLSKYFISFTVKIIKFLKNIISKIITIFLIPFKFIFKIIKKIMFKPITFITINIVAFFKKNVNFLKLFNKNKKNTSQKKDFPV